MPGILKDNTGTLALDVRELRMRYGTRDVLAGVSFTASRGEVLALLGPNGAGNTTAIEILEGFRMRSGGDVSVLGSGPATSYGTTSVGFRRSPGARAHHVQGLLSVGQAGYIVLFFPCLPLHSENMIPIRVRILYPRFKGRASGKSAICLGALARVRCRFYQYAALGIIPIACCLDETG
jgi:hypothetical protein